MPHRVIRPPRPPPLPAQLPFEDTVDRLLNRAAQAIDESRLGEALRRLDAAAPQLEGFHLPTPLGAIDTPALSLPVPIPPAMDARRREIVKAAAADDLSGLLEKVPWIGIITAPLADAVEDIFGAKIEELMTPGERKVFREKDKVSPSTVVSTLQTFAKRR